MYTIKRAAELTGISVATLRAWERRYAVVRPRRSDGGYRIYDSDDVRALETMNSLVQEGWSPREAAAETHRRLADATRGPEADRQATPGRTSGRVDRSDDAQAFLAAAGTLADDPALRERLGKNALDYATRTFDIDAITARFAGLLERVVAAHRAAHG